MTEVEQALKKALVPGFWGELGVTIRDGKPAVIHITETRQLNKKENPSYGSPYSQNR